MPIKGKPRRKRAGAVTTPQTKGLVGPALSSIGCGKLNPIGETGAAPKFKTGRFGKALMRKWEAAQGAANRGGFSY